MLLRSRSRPRINRKPLPDRVSVLSKETEDAFSPTTGSLTRSPQLPEKTKGEVQSLQHMTGTGWTSMTELRRLVGVDGLCVLQFLSV